MSSGPAPQTKPAPRAGKDSARAWVNVGTAFVSMFVVFGVAYSFGAFFEPMAAEFGSGSGATSAVFSITAFCYFALGSVSGWATDRVGPRPVLLVGAVALGAGLVLTAQVDELWLGYLSYGLGVGVGVACGYVPMVAVVGAWFERRRGVALGVAVAGIGVGTLVVAPLAALLIDAVGWRTTFVWFGIAGAVLLIGCAAATSRPPEHDGDTPPPLRQLLRTPAFLSLYFSTLLISLVLFVPFVFLPSFAAERGVDGVRAATLVGLIGMASVVGRLAIGALADSIGRVRTYQACFGIMAVSYAIWLVTSSYGPLVVFTVVLGVGYGGWIALSPAVVAELFGMRGLGRLIGLVYTAAAVGSLLGPPAAGLLIDATGTYRWAIAACMVAATGGFVTLLALRRPARPARIVEP